MRAAERWYVLLMLENCRETRGEGSSLPVRKKAMEPGQMTADDGLSSKNKRG